MTAHSTKSAAMLGAWIEILYCSIVSGLLTVAPYIGAWIEIAMKSVRIWLRV